MTGHKNPGIPAIPATRLSGLALALLSALFVFQSPSHSAPPAPLNNWSVSGGGQINSACPNNFTCQVIVQDQGILQRSLEAANGDRYIQLIVSDGLMNSESFTRLGGTSINGISGRQSVTSTIGGDTMTATIDLNTGWASGGNPAIRINQLLDSFGDNVTYQGSFQHEVNQNTNGAVLGTYTSYRQDLFNSTRSTDSTGPQATGRDHQAFVNRIASGNRVSNGSATLPAAVGGQVGMMGGGGGMMNGQTAGGGTVNWNAGNTVQVIWIGQDCVGCPDPNAVNAMNGGGGGGGGMGGGGGGMIGAIPANTVFAYQSFDNLSDGLDPIATASLAQWDPFTWVNPPFGLRPTLN